MYHSLEKSIDSIQLCVARFVVPTNGRHGILRLEKVGHRRVVYNDYILHRSTKSCQIFHIRIIKERAVLTEQKVRAHLLWVQMCHQRLGILGQTGCEDDQFVYLVHALEELSNEWTH